MGAARPTVVGPVGVHMTKRLACLALALAACTDNSGSGVLGGSLTVSGTVNDFQTSAAVAGAASLSTTGLLPPPRITVQGSEFTLDGVPENSAFQILASVPPTHRATY